MKLNKGFTVTELLITLGIIGFLAAVSVPVLIQNVERHKACVKLAKFDNTFSTALESSMSNLEIDRLDTQNINAAIQGMSRYTEITTFRDNYNYNGNNISMQPVPTVGAIIACIFSGCTVEDYPEYDVQGDGRITVTDVMAVQKIPNISGFRMKDGTLVILGSRNSIAQGANHIQGNNFGDMIAEMLVDIDGNRDTNSAGEDVFAFFISASGELVPAGSQLQRDLDVTGRYYIGGPNLNCSLSSENMAERFACTGRYADNGWSAKGLKIN